ncbi:Hypothetical predicted protein, partial [Prunus dulcis]
MGLSLPARISIENLGDGLFYWLLLKQHRVWVEIEGPTKKLDMFAQRESIGMAELGMGSYYSG